MMTAADLVDRHQQRISALAERARIEHQSYKAALENRDRAIVDAIDTGALSRRQAAAAAGVSKVAVEHVLSRI